MKVLTCSVFLLIYSVNVVAQPITNIGPLVSLDFDGNATTDILYSANAEKTRDNPEDWMIGFNVQPWGANRILLANNTRIPFRRGETISRARRSLTNYFENPPKPPVETYGVPLLHYRSIMKADWEYSTVQAAFESEGELFLGLKLSLVSGVHYGWVHFIRPLVNSYTQFDLMDYAFHPVPDEPINAGDQPPLPPIQTQFNPNGLNFTWDSRWGSLVLESSTNLVPPVAWETLMEGNGGPVTIETADNQRFYRLRLP